MDHSALLVMKDPSAALIAGNPSAHYQSGTLGAGTTLVLRRHRCLQTTGTALALRTHRPQGPPSPRLGRQRQGDLLAHEGMVLAPEVLPP
jgi:hypothetical protein